MSQQSVPRPFSFQCQGNVTVDQVTACEIGAWTLETWPITDPDDLTVRPFT